MAVTLLHSPEDISFSKNPIVFEFESDRAVVSPGSYFIGFLYFYNSSLPNFVGPLPGAILVFKMYNTSEVFTFSDSGTGQNELPVKKSTETVYNWMLRVIEGLQRNFTINNNYTLSLTYAVELDGFDMVIGDTGHYIKIVGNDLDSLSNIELTNESVQTAGMALTSQGSAIQYEINLRVYAELWVKREQEYAKVISATLPTDQRGRALWDIAAILNDELENRLVRIDDLSTHMASNDSVRYYLRYTEVYGESLTTGAYNRTGSKNAVLGGQIPKAFANGGLSLFKKADLCEWLSFNINNTAPILTAQPQFLTWLNLLETQNIIVKVRFNYSNGTYWVVDLYSAHVQKYHNLHLAVDYGAIEQLNRWPEQLPLSYSIYLVGPSGQVSPEMTYKVDMRRHAYAKVWAYRNSYGVMETLVTYGEKSYEYTIHRYQTHINDSFTKTGRTQDFDIELNDHIQVYTGYRTKDEIQQFRDFFLSSEKFYWDNEEWVPVNLLTNSIEQYSDNDSLYGFAFDVEVQRRTTIFSR